MRKISKKTVYSIITIELIICGFLFFHVGNDVKSDSIVNITNKSILPTNSGQIIQGLPLRLKIPIIKVNAPIESLGLTSDGAMDDPVNSKNAGWYNLGTIPGKEGSAVIGGHHGLTNNIGVFYNIDKLRKGDLIYIENTEGETITFVVREHRIYNFQADTKEIFTSTNGTHLNLITCVGDRDKIKNIYTYRLVVFADRIK